jgi:eukaryotic-like serine/threonine-protein kinase
VARVAAKPSRGRAARFRALATGNDRSMAAWEQLGLPPRYHGPTLIARGGMADLYRALDTALDRDVAIKVLGARFAADGEIRERFLREAHTAAQLSGHPAIVTIYDVGETDGLPYIVMEYLPRGSLADRIAAGGVEPSKAVRWLDDVAEALDHAHARGVVHRDVKPANLLLDDEGQVHVVDFGIANAGLLPSLTATGTVMGTSGYISPEQASGARAGPASDRYALAVVAFELLTGRRPFQGDSFAGEASAHVNAVPPRPSSINKALPGEVDAVLTRGLAKDPAYRYESAAAFVDALRDALAGPPTEVIRPAPPTSTDASVRRRRTVAAALLGLLAVGAAGIALGTAASGGGDDHQAQVRTVVRTQTVAGAPETQTVTLEEPPTTTQPRTPTTSSSGAELNDRGFELMQRRDYGAALPVFEQAVDRLRGTGSLAEAYASYNLAYTRFALGSCDGVLELLDRSQAVQGHRREIDRLRKQAEKACDRDEG